ncbi:MULTISPECIES: S8 family serine peptidase [unclassified Bosea (in: a-proteobacteria)]|uniref:S8 family serine peptidase n=1 Tax=unclassified Bosea (in: a-proteobacteria) TaxID=2653178 RepID=UPI0013DF375D|nr:MULTISPECIES: S8 family serine peptidase [unclassified Bosea (in: a-proteobacteria)]
MTKLTEKQRRDEALDANNLIAPNFPLVHIGAPAAESEQGEDDVARRELLAPEGVAWGIAEIGADKATEDGRDALVAVLDTGIKDDHPAFPADQITLVQKNFTKGVPHDVLGHGTHCASTIFGRDADGIRIGVARGVRHALIGKVFDDHGGSSTAILLKSLLWCHELKANIVSMSLGLDFVAMQARLQASRPPAAATSLTLRAYLDVVRQFEAQLRLMTLDIDGPGALIIAASGNESRRDSYTVSATMPAAMPDVVSVAALGGPTAAERRKVASFSNTNPVLSAPGYGILGADHRSNGLVAKNGTSMACPHVAGLAALHWQAELRDSGVASARQTRSRLELSCNRTIPGYNREDHGRGLAQAPPSAL